MESLERMFILRFVGEVEGRMVKFACESALTRGGRSLEERAQRTFRNQRKLRQNVEGISL